MEVRATDLIYGEAGADTLIGGTEMDLIDGGADNDLVQARDGANDIINCGGGTNDVAVIDTFEIPSACEVVQKP